MFIQNILTCSFSGPHRCSATCSGDRSPPHICCRSHSVWLWTRYKTQNFNILNTQPSLKRGLLSAYKLLFFIACFSVFLLLHQKLVSQTDFRFHSPGLKMAEVLSDLQPGKLGKNTPICRFWLKCGGQFKEERSWSSGWLALKLILYQVLCFVSTECWFSFRVWEDLLCLNNSWEVNCQTLKKLEDLNVTTLK